MKMKIVMFVIVFLGVSACGDSTAPAPTLLIFPAAVSDSSIVNEPTVVQLTATSSGNREIPWTAQESLDWVTLDKYSSSTPGVINVSLLGAGLPGGVYSGAMTVSAGTQSIPLTVTLKIPPIAGSWSMIYGSLSFNAVFTEAEGSISASGFENVGGASISMAATGTHANPAVSFTVTAPGYQPFTFSGHLTSSRRLLGVLNGSGFSNTSVVWLKQ